MICTKMKVKILQWHSVASWTWDAQDETCGICRMAFDGCCPDCKFPGDDCPLIWGSCNHAFHLHCILKWGRQLHLVHVVLSRVQAPGSLATVGKSRGISWPLLLHFMLSS
uniref:Anaphase-promoting complex subunit 11 RING-H2 finger domain-containing protein n=1 Tax=Oryza meridionalis TaxID=40149 RepID=A0A0E0CZE5_9ORYZ